MVNLTFLLYLSRRRRRFFLISKAIVIEVEKPAIYRILTTVNWT